MTSVGLPQPRRNWAGAAGKDALSHAAAALARAGFADPSLVLRWTAIAGAEIARITQPVKLQEGADGAVLTLKCEAGSAVFLQHQTRSLIGRVNSYLGASRVARIKLVPGRLYDLSEPLSHPSPRRNGEASERACLSAALEGLGEARARLSAARKRPLAD